MFTRICVLTAILMFAVSITTAQAQSTRPAAVTKFLAKAKAKHAVTLEQRRFRLDVYQRTSKGTYSRIRRYKVAVGLPQFPTPNGTFRLGPEIKNPSWLAPHSPWVPKEMRGKLIKYTNPLNPFVRWFVPVLGKDLRGKGTDGVGVHGTKHPETIGTRASHGCIRMTASGISSFVRAVEPGNPILIIP